MRLLNPELDPRLESGERSMLSMVCGVDIEAIEESDDPRLLNSDGEVKLCSNVDPRLVESGE